MSDQLTRILVMIPDSRLHPVIALQDLARYLYPTTETILADLDAVLLCGAPPYLPNDYIGVVLEGDRI